MAFQGDLSNVNLFDVFQTLLQNRQSGVLVLQRGTIEKRLHISPEGVRLLSAHGGRPFRVGEIFVQRGYITPQDVEILLLEQKERYRPIGELIVATGKVKKAEIDALLRYHAEDEVYDLFGWEQGTFSFLDGQSPDERKASPLSEVRLDPMTICLDAARRLDETARLRERIPNNEEFFTRTEGVVPDFHGQDDAHVDLYEALHTPHSVDELRDLVGLTLFEVLAGLVELLEDGIIRPLDVNELVDAAQAAEDRGEEHRAAILFQKAQYLRPDDAELLEVTIRAVQKVGNHARLSELFLALGRIHRGNGDCDEAIEALERALRSSPDRTDVVSELIETFAANEELDRAIETTLKLARLHEDAGDLEAAFRTLERGLELVPDRTSLRLHRAQLLIRQERQEEAREEIVALIAAQDTSRKGRDNRHTRDLIQRCVRLLLQIDPTDAEAHQWMRTLESTSEGRAHRRMLLLRIGLGLAGVALLAVLGVAALTGGASGLLAEAREAQTQGDLARVGEIVAEIEARWPNSSEALEARALREAIAASRAAPPDPRLDERRERIREALGKVRDSLRSTEFLNGVATVRPFLDELNDTKLPNEERAAVLNDLTYQVVDFIEALERQCRDDLRLLVEAEHRLHGSGTPPTLGEVRELEGAIDTIRKRGWGLVAEGMDRRLTEIRETKRLTSIDAHLERCRKAMIELVRGFDGIGRLQDSATAARLNLEIAQLVERADREGSERLARCELDRAREIYQAAWNSIDSVYGYDSSGPIDELKARIERDGIRDSIRSRLRAVESVQASLALVEKDVASGDPQRVAAAYARLRELVFAHVRIGFGQRYRLPVHVDTRPVGARVLVDGEPAGTAPTTLLVPIERESTVTLRLDGFEEATARIDVTDASFEGLIHVPLRKTVAWRYPLAVGVSARPVVEGDTLLFATTDCSLYAVDLATGRARWPAARSGLLFNVQATPFVSGACAVFITTNGVLHRVRMEDGAIADRYAIGGGVVVDTAHVGDRVWLATLDRRIVCLSLGETIEKVFEAPLARSPSTGLAVGAGRIAYGTSAGELVVLDASTGEEVTRIRAAPNSSFLGGVATLGNVLVGGAEDGRLYAWSLSSPGEEPLWTASASEPVSAPPLVKDDVLYVPTRDGTLHVLGSEGNHTHADLGGALLDAQPAVSGHVVYLLGRDRITAWDKRTQGRMWEYRLSEGSARHVAASAGTIVVVTEPPSLIAFPGDGE